MRQKFLCVALLAIAPSAHAGATVWIAGTGTWNTPGNWSGGDVPDMLGDVAVIGLPTAVVNLNISPTIDGVAITHAAARLNLGGFTLSVLPLGLDTTGLLVANAGTSTLIGNLSNTGAGAGRGIEVAPGATLLLSSPIITNSGRIDINPTNAGVQTTLQFNASGDLGGTGQLALSGSANRAILATGAGATITQAAAHTIRGLGQINASLINNGLVSADVAGNILTLQTNAKTNNGTLEGTNASFLDITGITITQGLGGLLLGDGGTVRLSTVTIDGGSTNTLDSGAIQVVGGSNTLNSITNLGDLDQGAGTTVVVTGNGLTNTGVYDVNPTNAGVQTVLQFNASGDLGGTGQLALSGSANRAILATGAGATITQAAAHTIRGLGQINASLINNGLVSADVAGNILTLQVNSKTNNSLMQATNASFLDITGITITQDPVAVIAADAATVRLSSATINNGMLTTMMGGLIQVVGGSNTLNSITTLGDLDQIGGTTVLVTGNGLTNTGVYDVNPTNAGVQTVLQFNDNGDLDGTGQLALSGSANRAILATGAGATITQAAAHTIRGLGQINASLINNGLVSADVAGNILTLQVNSKTNNSLMQATNASFLDITGITITQDPVAVIAADAATVRLSSATINNGMLTTMMGGLIQVVGGSNTLNSITTLGDLDQIGGTTVLVTGNGLTNTGVYDVNPTNAGVQTVLQFNDNGDLDGTGQLALSGLANRAILSTGAGATITQATTHTIRGLGQINAALINNGTISADVAANILTLQTNSKTNNSLMQATNASFLDITGIIINQDPAAVIAADAATVRLSSATISGGTIASPNGGSVVGSSGTNTLTSVKNTSAFTVGAGTSLLINGTGLVNDGALSVNPTNAGVQTVVQFTQTGSLTGSGSLLLSAIVNRAILTASAGVIITNGSGHTIRGFGQITAPSLINSGTIATGPSAGTLDINGVVTQTPSGILHFDLGGTAGGQFGVLPGTGTINLGGTLRARLVNAHVPPPAAVYTIVTTANRPGRFAAFDLPPGDWRVEYLDNAVRLKLAPHCFGDSDFNNTVNFADITEVLTNFGTDYSPAPGTGPGDATRDGIVNFADITNVLTFFAATCP